MTDDARGAATIRTTLSGSVIAAALVVLGAQAAIATFTTEKKESLLWFYVFSTAASLLLLASMVAGAKGITAIYHEGYGGTWQRDTGKKYFGRQAVLAVTGALAVLLSVNMGTLKPAEPVGAAKKIEALERKLADLEEQLQATRGALQAIGSKPSERAAYDEEARRNLVELVQGALKAKALYQDGAIDGLAGPRTRHALREFQRREGLAITGRMDSATLKRLGL